MTNLSPHSRAQRVSEPLTSPTNTDRRDAQRSEALSPHMEVNSYVFVDEQNRQKRLKVVRACEGCRRRKIRCDAANTNRWPCSSCIRLRLQCIPPTAGFEGDEAQEQDQSGQGPPSHYVPEDYAHVPYTYGPAAYPDSYPSFSPMAGPPPIQYQALQQQPPLSSHGFVPSNQILAGFPMDANFMGITSPQASQITSNYTVAPPPLSTDDATLNGDPDQLASAFVDLSLTNNAVGQDAVAVYIKDAQRQGGTTTPASNDDDYPLPPHVISSGRIPPEWMPNDNLAFRYFDYFFKNIHPYVPVISESHLYRMWQTNKHAIHPLLLEAVFACAALGMEQVREGNKWLALAANHEERYKDSPRLSTIQGMLILLKAREAVPRKGYYYRSWLTIVHLVQMARDLDLHEHLGIHDEGEDCDAESHEECATKTRVWHVLFAVELIVGGPQGRTNFGVDLETVDFTSLVPLAGIEEKELLISQDFVHFLRAIRNVRETNLLFFRLKKEKNEVWAADPRFTRHNPDFDQWAALLPAHLMIEYPPGNVAPHIGTHFVANLHAYQNLSVLVHFRPQLELASKQELTSHWKPLILKCLEAAKNICRLQEAIWNSYGMAGFFHMLRGINFHIYAILTSINIHLVALTSPDPEAHFEAPEYFTRHMCILETCSSSWPMPELQQQIQSLRQAFSADLDKPFELKSSYIYGSPKRSDSLSPDQKAVYLVQDQSTLAGYNGYSMTPSTVGGSSRADFVPRQSAMMMNPGHGQYDAQAAQRAMQWDPSRIFDQWNIAFGGQAPTPTSQTTTSPAQSFNSNQLQDNTYATYAQQAAMPDYVAQLQNQQQLPQHTQAYTIPAHSYITPIMWREAVTSAQIPGVRRRMQGSTSGPSSSGAIQKRR